jgi:nucleotide-binding universal stress UspA family protein
MFENVLVGVDGRPGGDDAVALARQLAAPGAHLTLANIYGAAGWPPGSGGLFLDDQRVESDAFLEREADRWPGTDTASACASTVGRGLHELAVDRRADLLVVGSTHRGIPGKVLVGDDTRAAFNGAPCPIAIAPHGYAAAGRPVRQIGVGYDGTPESRLALDAALWLSEHTGAAVTALWVLSLEDVRLQAPLPADWLSTSAVLVGQAEAELAKIEGIDGAAIYGGPREELAKLSADVDLLVVGSRSHGRFGAFHGSVSSYLERHVASALLVLPPAPVPAVTASEPTPAQMTTASV